jgi:hypothetical protein
MGPVLTPFHPDTEYGHGQHLVAVIQKDPTLLLKYFRV